MKAKFLSAKVAFAVACVIGFAQFAGSGDHAYVAADGEVKSHLTAGRRAGESAACAVVVFVTLRVLQWGVRRKLRFSGRLPEDDARVHEKGGQL
jgi:hypothetical protein